MRRAFAVRLLLMNQIAPGDFEILANSLRQKKMRSAKSAFDWSSKMAVRRIAVSVE